MTFQLEHFPTKFSDTFSKSWVTYKSLFLYFIPLMLLFNLLFAMGYFFLNEQKLWSILYIDTTKFFIAKISDAFACFLLPFFLYQKLDNPLVMTQLFLKKYFKAFLITILPLSILLKYILAGNFLFSLLALSASFFFLFVFCFLVVNQNNIFNAFQQSFLLIITHRKKVLFFFISVFMVTSFLRFVLELIFFFPEIQSALANISTQDESLILQDILKIALTPKFYFFHSLIYLIFQPFLSIFVAILFYSLCSSFSKKLITDFFQPFQAPHHERRTKTKS